MAGRKDARGSGNRVIRLRACSKCKRLLGPRETLTRDPMDGRPICLGCWRPWDAPPVDPAP